MIRRVFVLALAAAVTPAAHAIELSYDGTGDAVLLPYYTVRDDVSTVMSVTNHSDTEVKAVRIAVAEGSNGRVALSTNIYLKPRASWSGALVAGSDLPFPRLVSNDSVCLAAGDTAALDVALRSSGFTGSRDDGLGTSDARTESGQIEFIELGVLTGNARDLVMRDLCSLLRQRFQSPNIWSADPNADVTRPTGSLSAAAQLIDVARGVAWDTPAYTFEGFSGAARHGGGSIDFDAVRISKPTLQPNKSVFTANAAVFPAERPADAVSHLLMADQLEGAFMLNESLAARSRWVVTFPTRRAYLDNLPGGELPASTPAVAPFAGDGDTSAPFCTSTTWQTIARDGALGVPQARDLCRQVNEVDVVRGAAGNEAVSSGGLERGMLRVAMRGDRHVLTYGYPVGPLTLEGTLLGLPAVGFSLMEASNSNAQPGLLASYAITGKAIRKQAGSPEP